MAKCSICNKSIVTGFCVCDDCYSKFFVADKLQKQPLPEQPQTNGDRIRSMNDEQLASALLCADFCAECKYSTESGLCEFLVKHPAKHLADGCWETAIHWLKSTAKD